MSQLCHTLVFEPFYIFLMSCPGSTDTGLLLESAVADACAAMAELVSCRLHHATHLAMLATDPR